MSARPFRLRGSVVLRPFQERARDAWLHGPLGAETPYRGTLAVYTGGGKTVIALACAEAAARLAGPEFRLVIVVPTIALADQWVAVLGAMTETEPRDIFRLQGARTAARPMREYRVVVAVINSAARNVAAFGDGGATMLVVDEAHRAGSPSFRAALAIPARFRLGLSATPERDDLDDAGEPIAFADQAVAQALGDVVFRFGLADAKAAGLLPSFAIEHHGLPLEPDERAEYERQSRQIDGLADRLRARGITRARARTMQGGGGESGAVARAYVGAVSTRKDLLYRATLRAPIALRLIRAALREPANKILVFNERIAEAEKLFRETAAVEPAVALEHSQLPIAERRRALDAFRDGSVRVLISAKSLIEGIDVPDATVGISVASTGSVRQRIQSIGRVLRNADGKRAVMHLLYVRDTTDDAIYGKENWDDLTGEATNRYFAWTKDAPEPVEFPGPPHAPKPTEQQEHDRLAASDPSALADAVAWRGMIDGVEYSVDTKGAVRNIQSATIANPQGVAGRLETLRGAKGGRITVTPRFRYVLASKRVDDATQWYAIARLDEPFVANAAAETDATPGAESLDRANGAFRIRQLQGGVIERNVNGVKQWALTTTEGDDPRGRNARTLLQAWRARDIDGCKFFVSSAWDAWFLADGTPSILCNVPGGFAWPDSGGA